MKPILSILVALLLFSASSVNAQFRQGTLLAGAGVGLGESSDIVPLGAQVEWGVSPKVGIGYFGAGLMGGVNFVGGGTNLWFGAHGSYHFDIPEIPQLDLFLGLGFAFNDGRSGLGLQGGVRYFLSKNFALYLKGGDGWYRGFFGFDIVL